ncbi:2Fe-2S iron-sulfur cluster-binding protein, partial [Streptomyces shenzhenensis]
MKICVTVDGERLDARQGQTVAGLLMSSGRVSWRTTAGTGRPRGLFCGIGVCFD